MDLYMLLRQCDCVATQLHSKPDGDLGRMTKAVGLLINADSRW